MSRVIALLKRIFGRGKPRPVVRTIERTVEIAVLSQEQFQELEKRLPGSGPTSASTPEEYAYNLGVAHTLRRLREGFTVDPSSSSRSAR